MGLDWKKVKIGDIGKVVGGGTPSTKIESYYGGSISWITPKDLSNFNSKYIFNGERSITEEGLNNSSAKLLPKGTVLFSSRAPIGYITIAGKDISTNQGFKSVIPNENTTTDFLYYLLIHNTEKIKNQGSGSTFREVSGTVLKNIEVNLPPIEIQKKVSRVLSALDKKIEINNKIIENLEQQAQVIFKSWFVDFEPFQDENFVESELGLIPEGWDVGSLGKSKLGCIISSGINGFMGEKIYLATADISDTHITNISTKVTFDDRPSRANMQPTPLSVWFAKMKDSRKLIFVNLNDEELLNNMIFSTGFAGIQASEISFTYLWAYLLSDNFDKIKNSYTMGTTMQAINNTNIKNIKNVIPPETVLEEFTEMTMPMIKMVSNLRTQNRHLAQTRDTLLPKLMSGEIDISNIKIDDEDIDYE